MSADRWSQCPICAPPEMTKDGIDNMYEVLPLETKKREYTIREHFEFYLNSDGILSVSYFGKCENCGAEWDFSKTGIKHTKGVSRND